MIEPVSDIFIIYQLYKLYESYKCVHLIYEYVMTYFKKKKILEQIEKASRKDENGWELV